MTDDDRIHDYAGGEVSTRVGRVNRWLLAVYAFAIFGYITATIASLFVSQDVIRPPSSTEPAASDDPGNVESGRARSSGVAVVR